MKRLIFFADVVTYSRLVASFLIIFLILKKEGYIAAIVVLFCSISDLLDGLLVKLSGIKNIRKKGAIIDPLADKFVIIGGYSSAYFFGFPIPSWLYFSIIIYETLLISIWLLFFKLKKLLLPQFWGKITVCSLILSLSLFLLKLPHINFYSYLSSILLALILVSLVDYFKKYILWGL